MISWEEWSDKWGGWSNWRANSPYLSDDGTKRNPGRNRTEATETDPKESVRQSPLEKRRVSLRPKHPRDLIGKRVSL